MFSFFNRIPPLARVALRYGIIGGLLGFTANVILYYIGRHPSFVFPLFDLRVGVFGVFMFFILKELRDYHFGGLLFFWQGLAACGIFLITFAVLASLLMWIFAINVPGFVTEYIELATNQLKSYPKETVDQIGKETFDRQLGLLSGTTAGSLVSTYFVQCFGIGLFISIIISVILRRQPQMQ